MHLFVIRIDWFWLEFIMVWKSVSPWISSAPACRAVFNLTISKYFDRDWSIFQHFWSNRFKIFRPWLINFSTIRSFYKIMIFLDNEYQVARTFIWTIFWINILILTNFQFWPWIKSALHLFAIRNWLHLFAFCNLQLVLIAIHYDLEINQAANQ